MPRGLRLGQRIGQRIVQQRHAERDGTVLVAYLAERFSSPTHAALPSSVRGEQLQRIALHYLEHAAASGWRPGLVNL